MFSLVVLAACGQAAVDPGPATDLADTEVKGAVAVLDLPHDSTPHVDEAARISQELAWRVIQNADGPNRLTSPSSLSMSLVQAAEGAQTVSLASIDGVLGLTGDDRSRAFGALRQSLQPYDSLPDSVDVGDPPETPVVHQASQVVAVERDVEQPFLDRLAEYYDASATEVSRDEAKAVLDAWAAKHTAGLIDESAIEIHPDTAAVLQDALLFAAAWRTPFTYEPTIPFEGRRVDGVAGIVTARYAEGDGWVAVRLPYDDNLAADVLVPERSPATEEPGADEGPASAFTHEDLEAVTAALDAAPESQLSVTMPSFDLKTSTDLIETLPEIDLGDLGGIVPGASGEQWVQQVALQVSAEGTVGAALTEMEVVDSAPMVDHEFTVDRPYVFRVLDTRTSWPLFLAAISDPTAGP